MSRRQRDEESADPIAAVALAIFAGAGLWVWKLWSEYATNRKAFIWDLVWSSLVLIAMVAIIVVLLSWRKNAHDARIQRALDEIKRLKLGDEVKNFIRRFGHDKGKKDETWVLREYKFRNDRLGDFQKILSDRGLDLGDETLHEVLERLIQQFSFEETAAGMSETPRPFASLSGADFERLLTRLYEKSGYIVQLIGRTGDQGADLIATKGGERLIIQAKRYAGSVGNAAVQEVVAAKNHYDGNVAIVVTTSDFTREAVELAKTNSVFLIGRKELQRLLSENLKENWN